MQQSINVSRSLNTECTKYTQSTQEETLFQITNLKSYITHHTSKCSLHFLFFKRLHDIAHAYVVEILDG
jgi:hypothetical protein